MHRRIEIHLSRSSSAMLAAALAVACLAAAGCSASPPARSAATSNAATPSPSALASDPAGFDLSGSAWRALSIDGHAVSADATPRLEFDRLGRPEGGGFTGCDEFGFEGTFKDGRMSVGDLELNPSGCDGPGVDVEAAFLAAFHAAEAWSVGGDRLTLDGSGGQVVLARDLPPIGDPGRTLAETLRVGDWRIVRAPGVDNLKDVPSVRFTDTLVIAAEDSECGFSGDVRFDAGGGVNITDVDWDTTGCGAEDPRPELRHLLEAVTSGRPGPDGTIVLSSPRGDVVVGV